MLIAILALVFVHYNATGVWIANYEELLNTPMSTVWEYLLMLQASSSPSRVRKCQWFHFHGWLPDTHSQAPTAGSVDWRGSY